MISFSIRAAAWKNMTIILLGLARLIGRPLADLIQFGSGCSSLPVTKAERAAERRIALCRIHANLIASQMRNSFLIAMGFSFSGPREGTGAVYM